MKCLFPTIFLLLLSCTKQNEERNSFDLRLSDLKYDSISKTLTIDFDKISNLDIDKIELTTKKNLQHQIYLDSNKQITHLHNCISLDGKKTFVSNTWYGYDVRGNINKEQTFYYDTGMLQSKDAERNYVTYEVLCNMYGGNHYAIVGPFDEHFQLPKGSKVDTIHLAPNEPGIKIPLETKGKKSGKYNIRFIVNEDKRSNDTIYRNRTYVDRDYFIEREK